MRLSAALAVLALLAFAAPAALAQPYAEIDWAAARAGQAQAAGAVLVQPANPAAANLGVVRLPVLLPEAAAMRMGGAERAMIFPRENAWALNITGDGVTVEITGTRVAAPRPGPAAAARLRAAQDYQTVATETGWEVNFSRYGAAYSVTVECLRPRDARCTDGDYALGVARSLRVAGGAPR